MTERTTFLKRLSSSEIDAQGSPIDSEYFGVSSAKVHLHAACSPEQQTELLEFMHAFEFIRITNHANEPVNNHWLGERTSAFLTDINIQLTKQVSQPEKPTEELTLVTDRFPGDEHILKIAREAFTVSGFLSDPYLPREPARGIYADITRNAFGKAGRFFAIHRADQQVGGFLLFSITGTLATIELVATDESMAGRGIGKSLLRSMDRYAVTRGVENIQVGTQLANSTALKFYISQGFRVRECNSIYHYWPAKSALTNDGHLGISQPDRW